MCLVEFVLCIPGMLATLGEQVPSTRAAAAEVDSDASLALVYGYRLTSPVISPFTVAKV